ncbi:hypothetical protein [Pseudoalteromonas shioyasakiensis]|nr:hypothetical protein [Pseudoalteromonas shioyasakiensis]
MITKPFNREELFLKVENWIHWVSLYSPEAKYGMTAKEYQCHYI